MLLIVLRLIIERNKFENMVEEEDNNQGVKYRLEVEEVVGTGADA